jgi:hypothetical protein
MERLSMTVPVKAVGAITGVTILALWLAAGRPADLALFCGAAMVVTLMIVVGLAAAGRFGRGAMVAGPGELRRWSSREAVQRLAWSALLGFALGALLLGVIVFVLRPIEPAIAARLRSRAGAPFWMPLALAFESPVLEEVVFRLFLMSCLVWLIARGWRRDVREAAPLVIWSAIMIASAAFGLAHLPAWLTVAPRTPLLVGSVLVLNGLAGIALGRVYWQWGLEAATVCHFAADLAVQGLGPRVVACDHHRKTS